MNICFEYQSGIPLWRFLRRINILPSDESLSESEDVDDFRGLMTYSQNIDIELYSPLFYSTQLRRRSFPLPCRHRALSPTVILILFI